jgi:DNA-binding transcriptional LysR family regulator
VLDVHRLRLLRELSYRATLAAVADALGYSPSAVSQQLSQLEREAGARLLERVGRRVRLTAAAEVLVRHAGTVLAQLEEAEADLADLAGGGAGRLRISMFQSAAHTLLAPAMARLAETAPALELTVDVLEPETALPRLLAHDLDLVLTEEYPGHPLHRYRDLDRSHRTDDPIRLATPSPAGQQHREDLAAYADASWVLEPPGTTARTWAEAICRTAGFEPRVQFESTDLAFHLRLVQDGLATALLPDLANMQTPMGVHLERLPASPRRSLDTVVRRGARRHPHVVAVRDALNICATGDHPRSGNGT